MPDYGWCYNSATRCTGRAQPGVVALQAAIKELYPKTGSYGIYNCRPSRTGGSYSLHAEGRAWDCAIPLGETPLGNHLALLLVKHATKLGVQRVIWGFGYGTAAKEWDSRVGERYWEPYSGPAHDDHLHIELCWAASAGEAVLTKSYVIKVLSGQGEEDELTPEEKKRLEAVEKAVYVTRGGKRYEHINIVEAMLKGIGDKLGLKFNDDGTIRAGG